MRISLLAPMTVLLLTASSAMAEVTLSTDKAVYVVGEIVRISAHNSGPDDEQLLSYPYFTIWSADTDECVSGCLGLPVVDPFPAGQTISMEWDTGQQPDPPGTYIVSVSTLDGPFVSYVVTSGVPTDQSNWTILKTRYR